MNAFREAHPQCVVEFEWLQALLYSIKEADRLVVRSGGTCHRRPEQEITLYETRTPDDINELLSIIKIDETQSNGTCMCCGAPTLEFYRGSTLVAAVGIQHEKALRWNNWPADGMLTNDSAKAFQSWLQKHHLEEDRSKTATPQ